MIKPIKILKKLAGSVRFRFYKQKTEKTEKTKPNRNRKNRAKPEKQSQNGKTKPNRKNQAKPVWIGFCPKKWTEPNRNRLVWPSFGSISVFF